MEGDDHDRWMPVAYVLKAMSRHFSASLGLEDELAREKAIIELIDRLGSGLLFSSPKGLLRQYATEETDIGRWYSLWLTEVDGEKTKYQPDMGNESSHVVIPVEFWRPFQRGDDGALADWDAGDFRFDNVRDSDGTWSGRARDVHFDRLDLPSAWLAQARDRTPPLSGEGQIFAGQCDFSPDAIKGTLPASATNSERQHEEAAHAAAQFMRENRCRLAEAIRQVRHLVETKGRQEESIDRAIRQSYRRMYDALGLPIKN